MPYRTVALLALAALSVTSLNAMHRTHQRRVAQRPRAKAEPLQTWEGEGGGLPEGGPGPGVTVEPPPAGTEPR